MAWLAALPARFAKVSIGRLWSGCSSGAMTRRREHRVAVMAKPVLVVVDDEDASLQALTLELESRYGAHYRVVSGSSAEVALARLAELKAAGAFGHLGRHGGACAVPGGGGAWLAGVLFDQADVVAG